MTDVNPGAKLEYDTRVQQLVGRSIVDVSYHEILYKDETETLLYGPVWNLNPDFDSLDYGMDLMFSDGSMCHFCWGDKFVQYGLSIQWKPQEYTNEVRAWRVALASRWNSLLSRRIYAANVYWSWLQYDHTPERTYYPQTVQLTFDNSAQVYLSAFEIRGSDFQMGCMDHVTVFFDSKKAVEFGAWPVDGLP